MSLTERGTLMVEPLRSPSIVRFNEACSLVFSTTFSATFFPLATTSSELVFVVFIAFFVLDLVAFAVDLAAAEALAFAAAAFFFTDEPAAFAVDSSVAAA